MQKRTSIYNIPQHETKYVCGIVTVKTTYHRVHITLIIPTSGRVQYVYLNVRF